MNEPTQPASKESQIKNHIESILNAPETVNALDVSHLFVELDFEDFTDAFIDIIKAYKEKTGEDLNIEFIFAINDPQIEKRTKDKSLFLKLLKAFIETSRFSKHIKSITVKGPKGTVDLEQNVFASGIKFELMED